MSDKNNDNSKTSGEPDREMQAIFELAGNRPTPNAQRKAASKAQLRQVWQNEVTTNQRKRLWKVAVPIGIAASLALASFVGLQQFNTVDPALGRIIFVQGDIKHTSDGQINTSGTLSAGDLVVAQQGAQVTLRLNDTTIIQLAPTTQITLQGVSDIWLHHGKIFIDSEGTETSVLVRTAWGEIRDIGTQFEVSVFDENLELAMREGQAELKLTQDSDKTIVTDSRASEADLVLVESGTQVTRRELRRNAPRWNWIEQGTPDLPAGEQTLASVVTWAARHSGREIVYDSPLTVMLSKKEQVVWPAIKLVTLESQVTELSETANFDLSFTETEILVKAKR